ncbi:MAG: serine/threonine phosphatase [Heteroscytonema crispum UTEX LB 1556]
MLVCPQCKFENPNTNKFCQNCGTSLTHKVCSECGTDVAVNAQNCHKCDAESGTVWRAIIAKEVTQGWELGDGCGDKDDGCGRRVWATGVEDNKETSSPPNPISPSPHPPLSPSPPLPTASYLDPQQRYQLLEPLPSPEEIADKKEVCVRVLDCQPYQISLLSAMLANQQQGLVTSSEVEANVIPSLAKPYVALQQACYQGIPLIHDAWQQGDLQVVLIQDRSDWKPLVDLWREDSTSSLQIVHCFHQMTQLWTLLEPLNCRQSLLELSNLRLDEDQSLALQRLYVESCNTLPAVQPPEDAEAETSAGEVGQPLTIKSLGWVWQALFRQSQRTQFGSLVQLLGDLEINKIQTIAQLRSRLEAIATEVQSTSVASSTTPFTPDNRTAAPTILQFEDSEDSGGKSDDLPTVVLPMQLSSLEDAGRSDVGRQRHHNEDCFGVETKINKLELPKSRVLQARGLYILCDGMGGHAGGEIASELAVTTLRKYFQEHWLTNQLPTEDSIREAVRLANQAIYDRNQQDARSGVGRMGTTLVMLLIQDTFAAVAHVGDSRLYELTRKQGLKQITVDHEVGQREIARGVEPNLAYARPDAYQLTQALGPRDENSIHPDVQFFEINEDALFVLVSDGLSDNDLLEIHWQAYLEPLLSSGVNLERGVRDLIDLANQYNGHDNITAVLIRAKVRPLVENQK